MILSDAAVAMGVGMSDAAEHKLRAYLALLSKWNKVYNLTAIRDPQEMLTHHVLDAMAILPHLDAGLISDSDFSLADIGSGAGLPGLVLAILRPAWAVTSVEAVEKKAAFQRQAKIELALDNVSIYCGRAEEFSGGFDAIVSRALSSLPEFIEMSGHLSDSFWAMKGGLQEDEIAALPSGWRIEACHSLRVPGLDAQRHLIHVKRVR